MSDEEIHVTAVAQREKANVLAAAQLFFIKGLCAAIIPALLAGIAMCVQDHEILKRLVEANTAAAASSLVNTNRIIHLEKLAVAPETRFTRSMMVDYNTRLKGINSNLKVPDVQNVYDTHYWELPHN